ncbi:MAG: LysR family transcriptional regulator [Aquificaceae bacterium]
MIDITKLKTFVAVADLGSFSRASEILYVTQPAVTQQIKALEKIVGAKLLQRLSGKIVLTDEGKRIYQIAKNLLSDYENLMEEMSKIKKDFKDTLLLGVSMTLSEYKVPELIAEFHSQLPNVNIRLTVDNSQHIEDGVASGVLNLGIIEREPSEKFSYVKWIMDEVVFFVGYQHPFAKREEIEPEELYKIPLVFREVSSGTRKVVRRELERLGVIFERLNIRIETNSSRTIINMVKNGYGGSFLSRGLISEEVAKNRLVEVKIKGFNASRWHYIIYPENERLTFLAGKFTKFLLSKESSEIVLK